MKNERKYFDLSIYGFEKHLSDRDYNIWKLGCVIVWDFEKCVSIDISFSEDHLSPDLVVCSRYECSNTDELEFLLSKGRAKVRI